MPNSSFRFSKRQILRVAVTTTHQVMSRALTVRVKSCKWCYQDTLLSLLTNLLHLFNY